MTIDFSKLDIFAEGDFETFCELDVTKVGAWAYSQHPSCDIICYQYKMPGDTEPRLWLPGNAPPRWRLAGIRAHNALFEACVIKHVAVPRYGWEDFDWDEAPELFRCSLAEAAFRALPLGLEKLAMVLQSPTQKDMVGNRAMKKIAKPDKDGNRILPEDDPEAYDRTYSYCGDDVKTEEYCAKWTGPIPAYELSNWKHDLTMQVRGLRIDQELCRAAIALADDYKSVLTEKLIRATNGAVQSHTKLNDLHTWLALNDFPMVDMKADTLDAAIKQIKDPESPIRQALEVRRYLSRSSADKYRVALKCLGDDGRVHGATQYYGATTGRNTGRLFQPLNMRRPVFYGEGVEQIELLAELVKSRDVEAIELVTGTNLMEALGDCARGMIIAEDDAEFCSGDYSAVESVVTAGCANEQAKLQVFRNGDDPYCWFAEKVVGHPVTKKEHPKIRQQIGKPGELAFGFSGGVGAWRNFDDSDNFTDDEVDDIKNVWRKSHPRTVEMWKALDKCAIKAILDPGEVYTFSPPGNPLLTVKFVKRGDFLLVQLPSGRRLHYFHPFVKETLAPWTNEDGSPCFTLTVFYWTSSGKHWRVVKGWRGQWTENIVQATARDLLMIGVKKAEAAGYRTILTVYDENLTENPRGFADKEEFERLITDIKDEAPWAADWPIKCDAWIGPRYNKAA